MGYVKLRALFGLAAIACFQQAVLATVCSDVPPCARVRVASVLFVGIVIDAGVAPTTGNESPRDVRFQVDEAFAGLPPEEREVVVRTTGSWLVKGHSYLIDAARGDGNYLYPTICGTSAEVNYERIADVLDYLRQRARGKAKTSLAVNVTDQYNPVPGVDVTISGPAGNLTSRSDIDGVAAFSDIQPARYRVSAARAHYHLDTQSYSNREVDVVAGTCVSSRVALRAEATVRGLVRDAKGAPVTALEVELVTAPEDALSAPALAPWADTNS